MSKQPDNWKNKLFYGDNLDVMKKYIKDETIDLCYIDPPFNPMLELSIQLTIIALKNIETIYLRTKK